jgi:hypothetical protein
MKHIYTIFASVFILELIVFGLIYFEQITGNLSSSAPKGLYLRTAESNAEYLTFCLDKSHKIYGFYYRFCSPDNQTGQRIIKRIKNKSFMGEYIVIGLHNQSIDSTIIGPIKNHQIKGFWKHLSIKGNGGILEK